MPNDEYDWTPKKDILSYEEVARLCALLCRLGVEKVRLTGGEPLVRQDLENLVVMLRKIPALKDISLTTNGALLTKTRARRLKEAGLNRVNISLDSLRPERFAQINRRGKLAQVLSGIEAAKNAGLGPVKINAVILRGINDDEIVDLFEFARQESLQLRFIEYMDVGQANGWDLSRTMTQTEILEVLSTQLKLRKSGRKENRAPAMEFVGEEGNVTLGVIASVSEPFCSTCTRARLTADGRLVTCLFAQDGFDLRRPLREGSSDAELGRMIQRVWSRRGDRYSEERLEALLSEKGYDPKDHQKIEMIRLGG
jgi:cyclic pyranopterin phosphate synthase